jgi:hypothetical protein
MIGMYVSRLSVAPNEGADQKAVAFTPKGFDRVRRF